MSRSVVPEADVDNAFSQPNATVEKPIFFMHIAKTAGSLLNSIMAETLGRDQTVTHCERFMGDKITFPTTVKNRRFVSGHVYFGDWRGFCARNGIHSTNVTFVREPMAHLISHIRWLDHYNIAEFRKDYVALDRLTQEVVDQVRDTNFEDAGSIDHFLTNLTPRGLQYFDNCQSRYFIKGGMKGRFDQIALDCRPILAKIFKSFSFVGISEYFEADLGALGKIIDLPLRYDHNRLNESPTARNIDAGKPLIRRVLQKRILVDEWLYQMATRERHRNNTTADVVTE